MMQGIKTLPNSFNFSAGAPADVSQLEARRVVLWYVVAEFILSFVAALVSRRLCMTQTLGWGQSVADSVPFALVFAASVVVVGIVARHYENLHSRTPGMVVWSAIKASFTAVVLCLLLFRTGDFAFRGAIISQPVGVGFVASLSRGLFNGWLRRAARAGRLVAGRAFVFGGADRILAESGHNGLLARLRAEGIEVKEVLTVPVDVGLGEAFVAEAVSLCRNNVADRVVVLPSPSTMALAEHLVTALSETPVTIYTVPFASMPGGAGASQSVIGGQPAIVIYHASSVGVDHLLKRIFDVFCAVVVLFTIAPLLLAVAIAIKLDTIGPVFFRQTRHGLGNRIFYVYKFRSMRVAEDGAAFRQATKNDPRITRVGRFIRRTNLDELPQLLNVLFGDMSLVGPRPHPVALNESFAPRIRLYNRRHNILPGITGWAQINGHRGETETENKMRQRIEHDLWYVDNWSLMLDIRILVSTVFSGMAYRNAS